MLKNMFNYANTDFVIIQRPMLQPYTTPPQQKPDKSSTETKQTLNLKPNSPIDPPPKLHKSPSPIYQGLARSH